MKMAISPVNKQSQALIVFAILSITFVSKLLEAMSPALHAVGSAFDVPYTSSMMLLTIPVFISMPVALFVGPVAGNAIKYRVLLILGLVLMGLGGIAPFWLGNWSMILVARAIFGVGQGIIMPLVLALIFALVLPARQATMMGLQNVVAGSAGMIFSLSAGVLAEKSWRYPFLLNGVTLVVALIVLLFLPEPQRGEAPSSAAEAPQLNSRQRLPAELWIYGVMTFGYAILLFPSMGNISFVFHDIGLSSALAGTALMFLTGGATLAGLIFGSLFEKLGLRTISLGFLVACVSQSLFAVGQDFYIFAIGELLLGFGALGLAFAGLCMGAGRSVGPERSGLVMSITLTGMNIGTFASPLIFSAAMRLVGTTSMRFPFWVGVVGFGLLFGASLLLKPARRSAEQPLAGMPHA